MLRSFCRPGIPLLAICFVASTGSAAEVNFSREVLPLLSDRCFHCHGPDESHRKGKLRLDLREAVTADRGGYAIVVPGKPKASRLLHRVTSSDDADVMPPSDSNRERFTRAEVDILQRWIREGAKWGRHWAFEKPTRPSLPEGRESSHPVDAFVERGLEKQGLSLSPAAPKHTLLRRLSFDLTGLPPSLEELDAFLADTSKDAYETAVDRLLASKQHGERMAMWWLDAARYSDTDGYQADSTRNNWPWRDWVIDAFHRNVPYDQFTIEQFAGDLLPDAKPEQILATCFHRNHMTNGEGGRHPEESRVDYVIDRVNTTGTVWLGLTLGCCQCHSHKFDPISQKEYYGVAAFFNSLDEDGRAGGGAKPFYEYQSPYAKRAVAEAEAILDERKRRAREAQEVAKKDFVPWLEKQTDAVRGGFQAWHVITPDELRSAEGTTLTSEGEGVVQTSGLYPQQDDYRVFGSPKLSRVTGFRLEVFTHRSHTEGKYSRGKAGEFVLTNVKLQLRRPGSSELVELELNSAVANKEKTAGRRKFY
ncbi:MAG: DUF1549 domain-containing protein [Planctomycetota bacterium]